MCATVIVTEECAGLLASAGGNPHLIWDGAEAHVISEDDYRALHQESAWLLVTDRAGIADANPEALEFTSAGLAAILSIFGDGLIEECDCPAG